MTKIIIKSYQFILIIDKNTTPPPPPIKILIMVNDEDLTKDSKLCTIIPSWAGSETEALHNY